MTSMIRKILNQEKHVVVIFGTDKGRLYVKRKKTFSKVEQIKKVGDQYKIIDTDNPAYTEDNKFYYFASDNGRINYHFKQNTFPLSSDDIDSVLGNQILRQITRGVLDVKKEKLLAFILGAVVGTLVGVVIMLAIMQNKISTMYAEWLANEQQGAIIIPSAYYTIKGLILKCR